MADNQNTYSIRLRLRRVTYDDAYIAVPVTTAILTQQEDGTFRIDPEALAREAMRIGTNPRVEWQVEETLVEPHPVQGPLPEGRECLDGFYDLPDSQAGPENE